MQQHEIERKQGTMAYTIKVHSGANEETRDETLSLSEDISIKDLKCIVLSVVNQAFFLKFHMSNDQKLKELIKLTKEWNAKHGIDDGGGFLHFDIFLDRENYELNMEIEEKTQNSKPFYEDI